MPYPQLPPPPSSNSPSTERVQEIYELPEEAVNDQIMDQIYYPQTAESTISQTYTPTTYDAANPVDYATETHDSGTPHDPFIDSQDSMSESLQSTVWDFQDVSNQFASLATTSYEALQSPQGHPAYLPWEETIIPEGGVFPIDLPLYHQSTTGTESPGLALSAVPSLPLQQEPQSIQPEPIGGQTLVLHTVLYDDDEIPRNDPSWLLRPHKHPWVQSNRAYLCPFDSCQITIVQKKNKQHHNAIVHGILM